MRAFLLGEARHGQSGDHDKQPQSDQNNGDQVFTVEPAAGGQFEVAGRRDDEDQRRGTQSTLGRKVEYSHEETHIFLIDLTYI